jgi:hypothetical protein
LYIKSGTHELNNCSIVANGDTAYDLRYNGNGFNVTGSALVVDSCNGYKDIPPMNITLNDCTITSETAYGIFAGMTAKTGSEPYSYLSNLELNDCKVSGYIADSKIENEFHVSNVDQLMNALNTYDAKIVLESNIESDKTISIVPTADMKFEIDLNGHKFVKTTSGSIILAIKSVNTTYSIDSKLCNGELTSIDNLANYSIFANGNNIDLVLENIKSTSVLSGLTTNGNSINGSVVATNCEFVATGTEDGSGAYLPANYVYEFVNCTFTGYDGLYIKSGTHTYTGCTINGNGSTAYNLSYNGNGYNVTGAGLVIDSCNGYQDTPKMNIALNSCTITSENGYGLLEGTTASDPVNRYTYLQSLERDINTIITGNSNVGDVKMSTILI